MPVPSLPVKRYPDQMTHETEDRRQRVAAVLEQLEAGVRQRRAELAAQGAVGEQARLTLVELQRHEYLQDPLCVSPRPIVGPLLVLARKVLFKLFLKWYLHPVVQQQNRFNQLARSLLQELFEDQDRLGRELDRLARELDALRD